MDWYTFKNDKDRQTYTIRGTLWSGVDVKFPAYTRDEKIAKRRCANIEELNRAKDCGLPPSSALVTWSLNLPPKLANRLVELGLLDKSVMDRRRPIGELLDKWREVLTKSTTYAPYPHTVARHCARTFEAIGIADIAGLMADGVWRDVKNALPKFYKLNQKKPELISSRTVREHITSLKNFCNYLVLTKRILFNPLAPLRAPGQYENPVHRRCPLSVAEFHALMDYLARVEPYPRQRVAWSPVDRAMCYLAAAYSGFRRDELRTRTPAHLDFTVTPAEIAIDGADAKSGKSSSVPLPEDVAALLREYASTRPPGEPLFPMPSDPTLLTYLYRDLNGAGIPRVLPNGTLRDFHGFRSTAISWFIIENAKELKELNALDIKLMSRLSSLSLVGRYVEWYMPNRGRLVACAPKVTFARAAVPMGSAIPSELPPTPIQ